MIIKGGAGGQFCCFTYCSLVRCCSTAIGASLRIRLTVGDFVLSFEEAIWMTLSEKEQKERRRYETN